MSVEITRDRPSERLALTRTFRDGGVARWRAAQLHIIGAGNLGQRVAPEAALAGAHVTVYDPGVFGAENAETQWGQPGLPKVDHLVRQAEVFAPGRVRGVACDVRHVGIGRLRQASVLIDCSDDPNLAVPLTRISNGLGVPLLRGALAGDGQLELGRVACSHGGYAHACQMCTYAVEDLLRPTRRQPCAGIPTPEREPTLAGGAIGMTIAGIVLLQAQRLVTGNDLEHVLDREWIVDLTHGQLLPLHRTRSPECLSGHVRWTLVPLERRSSETSLRDLFGEVARRFELRDTSEISIEPYAHALCREWTCACGESQRSCGTRWLAAILCPRCGVPLTPQIATALDWLTESNTRDLGIDDQPLDQLGFPNDGAMFVARAPKKKPLRLILSLDAAAIGSARTPQQPTHEGSRS